MHVGLSPRLCNAPDFHGGLPRIRGVEPPLRLPNTRHRKQVILSNILREIFDRQQARTKEPALPEQLRVQAPERADGFSFGLQFGMEHMSDEMFAVYPEGVQVAPTDGITVLYLTMPKGYSADTFEARRVTAPPIPMELVCRPSRYGRTKTGDDVLEANREAFKSAKKNATTEAMWLDQLGVDFTRREFTLTPDGEHIASATIYLQDPHTVSELIYEATQKCIPGATGYYRRYLDPNGALDDAVLHVEIPGTRDLDFLTITGNRRDKVFLEWSIQLNARCGEVHPTTPLFTHQKVCVLFKYINDRIPERKYWGALEEEEEGESSD